MKILRLHKVVVPAALLLLATFPAFSQVQKEAVRKEKARSSLSDKVESYRKDIEEKSSNYFITNKYTATSSTTWRCHDPKIFQDPDTGIYYVYSTGWDEGVQLRKSTDLIHWTRVQDSPLWDPKDISLRYRHMHWDDDYLKWTGYSQNDGTVYRTSMYSPTSNPQSWAPTVVKQNGKYYMFHGVITDSLTYGASVRPAACITLAIADRPEGPFIPATEYDPDTYSNSSLVRYVWANKGAQHSLIGYSGCYNEGMDSWNEGFGCIDPEFVIDVATGKLVTYDIGGNKCYAMTYGSWKGGIALVYVDADTFKPVASVKGKSSFNDVTYSVGDEMDAPLDSIKNNSGVLIAGGKGAAYEGSQLIYNSDTGYYYIFVSMGDLTYEYRVGVGRSKNVEGPYVDTSDQNMKFTSVGQAEGYHGIGGKIIGASQLGDGYGWTSPGGQSIIRTNDGKIIFACHTRTNFMDPGQFTLQIRQMFFNKDGWPVLNQNEYYDESAELSSLTLSDIAGTYDAIITERSGNKAVDRTPMESEEITITKDGKVEGWYEGSVEIMSDGYTVVFHLGEGTFTGVVLRAVDWNKKGLKDSQRNTITFTALNSTDGTEYGEYFYGNKK